MPYQAGSSDEVGTLSITLSHPAQAFLYRATKPRLLVNGAEVAVSGWGTHRIQVPAGGHQVQIWVPYALPRKAGRAKAEVTVGHGAEVQLTG